MELAWKGHGQGRGHSASRRKVHQITKIRPGRRGRIFSKVLITAAAVEFRIIRIPRIGASSGSPPVDGVHALLFSEPARTHHSPTGSVIGAARCRATGVARGGVSSFECGHPSVRGFCHAGCRGRHLQSAHSADFGIERRAGRVDAAGDVQPVSGAYGSSDADVPSGRRNRSGPSVDFQNRIDDAVPSGGRKRVGSRNPVAGGQSGGKRRVRRRNADERYEEDGGSECRPLGDGNEFG